MDWRSELCPTGSYLHEGYRARTPLTMKYHGQIERSSEGVTPLQDIDKDTGLTGKHNNHTDCLLIQV
jgi:hypothetical protein